MDNALVCLAHDHAGGYGACILPCMSVSAVCFHSGVQPTMHATMHAPTRPTRRDPGNRVSSQRVSSHSDLRSWPAQPCTVHVRAVLCRGAFPVVGPFTHCHAARRGPALATVTVENSAPSSSVCQDQGMDAVGGVCSRNCSSRCTAPALPRPRAAAPPQGSRSARMASTSFPSGTPAGAPGAPHRRRLAPTATPACGPAGLSLSSKPGFSLRPAAPLRTGVRPPRCFRSSLFCADLWVTLPLETHWAATPRPGRIPARCIRLCGVNSFRLASGLGCIMMSVRGRPACMRTERRT